jgi:serine/threonine-protein kinase
MGAVYRASDTKLGRDVALKILPNSFAADPDRTARFAREAQVLASLNHPNIAAIYGVEEGALVLELVEGPTLAERIVHGPIPFEEALPIALQIAEALEYAHERGIIHRDLKPANIKLTPEGRVKVLDFGLAKALWNEPTAADPTSSPTLTMRATMAGMIIGTAKYMSPEQAKGKSVDRRTDIWAFGIVLYEMLTGRQMYSGETASETLAAVIKDKPDFSKLPADAPGEVRRLIARCLEKDPHQRLRDIGEARFVLAETLSSRPTEKEDALQRPRPRIGRLVWWLTGILAFAGFILSFRLWRATGPVERGMVRLNVDLGLGSLPDPQITAAISPDGARLVFRASSADGKPMLFTRLLDKPNAVQLPGTEDGAAPFFSPDGQWVGFYAARKIKKVPLNGGAPVTLVENVSDEYGASWSENGFIVAALGVQADLRRFADTGGKVQPVSRRLGAETTHRWPQILPGSKTLLFTASDVTTTMESARIDALNIATGERTNLVRDGYGGRYLSSGHLVFIRQGSLYAVPFDAGRLQISGTPVPVLDDMTYTPITSSGRFDFSDAGSFVYVSGNANAGWPVMWLDPSGRTKLVVASPALYLNPRLSPTGNRIALAITNGSKRSLYIYDLQNDMLRRLTFESLPWSAAPTWTPDGKHIVFRSNDPHKNGFQIWWMRSDGAGDPQLLLTSANNPIPNCFTPDGRILVYHEMNPERGYDLSMLPLDLSDPEHPKPGTPRPFLHTPAVERDGAVSPDGRWIAYDSDDTGTMEVYVRPFPDGASGTGWKLQVSSGGGQYPIWSHAHPELFFETPDNRIMAVSYTASADSLSLGKLRMWSPVQILGTPPAMNFDLAPDGDHVIMFPTPDISKQGSVHVTFLLNFFDYLRRRAPLEKK